MITTIATLDMKIKCAIYTELRQVLCITAYFNAQNLAGRSIIIFWGFISVLASSLNAQRTMYVDGFNTILNSSSSKTTLLQYAQSRQITSLVLYDLHLVHNEHDLTNATTNQILADFISNAKQNYGITQVAAAGENAWFFQNRIIAYNNTRGASNEKFDVLGMEFEFWTPVFIQPGGYYCVNYLQPNGLSCDSTGAFAFCKDQLLQMRTMADASAHPMTVEMYVGWPNAGQLKQIADIVDKTLIHAYVSNPNTAFNYALTRLQYYDTYAGVENVSIIYSAEPDFMGSWLASNSIAAAEQVFTAAYTSSSGAWKSHVNMQGFTYFTYSMMTNVALPVELTAFSGEMKDNTAYLTWEMPENANLQAFDIERSTDGIHFERVGTVPYSEQKDWHFADKQANTNLYYRLKILELNGQFTYSNTIYLTLPYLEKWTIAPNPTSGWVYTEPREIPFSVVNQWGQVVLRSDRIPEAIDLSTLTPGIYQIVAAGVCRSIFVR